MKLIETPRFAIEQAPETAAASDALLLRMRLYGVDEVLPFTRAELLELAGAIIEGLGAPRTGGRP